MSKIIMGIQLNQRHETAKEVQDLLTQYGCSIVTRVGLHQTSTDFCSEQGLIILEFLDDSEKEAQELEKALSTVNYVVVKKMEFQ
jgi:hypothetical protein